MKGGQEAIRFFMYIIFHLSCLHTFFLLRRQLAAAIAEATFKKDERGKIVIV
jgi:hypothetical protein